MTRFSGKTHFLCALEKHIKNSMDYFSLGHTEEQFFIVWSAPSALFY